MAGALIGLAVLDAMRARLEDAQYGYNAAIQQFAQQVGIPMPTVDFSETGTQVFEAYVDIANMDADTTAQYPRLLLYTVNAQNANTEKFRIFAGTVRAVLEVIHTWEHEEVQPKIHEQTAGVVEAAVYQIFNASDWYAIPCGVQYNGVLSHAKYPLAPFGEGYLLRQAFGFEFPLRVG